MNESKEVKALKESIAHWERWDRWDELGESYHSSDCECCKQFLSDGNCGVCPLRIFQGSTCNVSTPWGEYFKIGSKENALKMTAHLYKALAWQLEKEASKEKKEPVWDDITKEVEWRLDLAYGGFHFLYGYLNGKILVVAGGDGGVVRVSALCDIGQRIKIETSGGAHKILLRMDK